MDKRRVLLICGTIFLLFNSLYIGRNLIPGLTNGSISISDDFERTEFNADIIDFEAYDSDYYIITEHPDISRYNLTKIDRSGTPEFSKLFYSFQTPELISVNSKGILLIGALAPQPLGVSYFTLDGDFITYKMYDPSFDSISGITGAYRYEFRVFDDILYSILYVSTSGPSYSEYTFVLLESWNFVSDTSNEIKEWSETELDEMYSFHFYEEDEQPYLVTLEESSETEGDVVSYELSSASLSNRESHMVVALPNPSEVSEIKLVGFEEFYVSLPINALSYGVEIRELSTEKSELIVFEEAVVRKNALTLEVHQDLLLVALSVDIDYENSAVFFSLDKRGNNIIREDFDTSMFEGDDFVSIQEFEFSGDDLYIGVQEIIGIYQIYKFSQAYSGPILLDSIPPFIQFNILPILLTGSIVGYEFWKLKFREDVDNLEYPTMQEEIEE